MAKKIMKPSKQSDKLTKQDVITAAKKCLDPELDLDLWTLGLVYEIKLPEQKKVYIRMTLTSPMCPFGRELTEQFKDELSATGFEDIKIDLVFDPPWAPSPEVKELLGIS